MNKVVLFISIFIIILGAGIGIYASSRKKELEGGDSITSEPSCLEINHSTWGYWNDEDKNSGLLRKLAEKYFPESDNHEHIGSVIGGWFKGVNAYPRESMAMAYKKQIKAYVNSRDAAPWWLVSTGELEC